MESCGSTCGPKLMSLRCRFENGVCLSTEGRERSDHRRFTIRGRYVGRGSKS